MLDPGKRARCTAISPVAVVELAERVGAPALHGAVSDPGARVIVRHGELHHLREPGHGRRNGTHPSAPATDGAISTTRAALILADRDLHGIVEADDADGDGALIGGPVAKLPDYDAIASRLSH